MLLEDLEARLTDTQRDALSLLCPLLNSPVPEPIPVYTKSMFMSGVLGKWTRDSATNEIKSGENWAMVISIEPKDQYDANKMNAAESTTVHETAHYLHSIINPTELGKYFAEQNVSNKWGIETRDVQRGLALVELVADYLTLLWLDESYRLFDCSAERQDVLSVYQRIRSRKRRIELANQLVRTNYQGLAKIPEVRKYREDAEKEILKDKNLVNNMLFDTSR